MMGTRVVRRRYLESIADELLSQATRVRDLIGDRHWLSDGHHKEYLLGGLLRRHLPSGILVSRGFVVSPHEGELRSTEQDLLVIDTTREAPVFHQSELAICFPRTVLASISVKTTLGKGELLDAVLGLNTVRAVARDDAEPRSIWCGGYFFDACEPVEREPTRVYDYLAEAINASPVPPPTLGASHPHPVGPDALCTARDHYFGLDFGSGTVADATAATRAFAYACGGLASAFFIANLLDHVAVMRGLDDSNFCDFAELPGVSPLDEGGRLLRG